MAAISKRMKFEDHKSNEAIKKSDEYVEKYMMQ